MSETNKPRFVFVVEEGQYHERRVLAVFGTEAMASAWIDRQVIADKERMRVSTYSVESVEWEPD